MKLKTTLLAASIATLAALPMTTSLAAGGWSSNPSVAASGACGTLNALGTTTGVAVNGTNGVGGTFTSGDYATVTVTMGTATSSNVTIVGNSTGTPVLAGPLVGAGSISYKVTGPLPSGSIGIGWFVNSTTPANGTVNVTVTCGDAPVPPIPVWSTASLGAAALGLLGFGLLRLRRRR